MRVPKDFPVQPIRRGAVRQERAAWEVAYRRWRTLSEIGYGQRDHTPAHMAKVDERIRKAKEKYEALLPPSHPRKDGGE